MSIHFSRIIPTHSNSIGDVFSASSLELSDERTSPVMVVDDFRVTGRPFGPHPHAGFSAITYVFPDSAGSLRNRDSLGNHVVIGAGGICWLQAGSGAQHEEIPAKLGTELHGLQIFVNLSAKNKLSAPRVFSLRGDQVPEWKSGAGDRVRVVVGSYAGLTSPLVPSEPLTLLDVSLRRDIAFSMLDGHNVLVYVRAGTVAVRAGSREQQVARGEGLALFGDAGSVALVALSRADVVILSGAEIRENVVMQGPFIMNDATQIRAAFERYQSGRMGHLEPYAER